MVVYDNDFRDWKSLTSQIYLSLISLDWLFQFILDIHVYYFLAMYLIVWPALSIALIKFFSKTNSRESVSHYGESWDFPICSTSCFYFVPFSTSQKAWQSERSMFCWTWSTNLGLRSISCSSSRNISSKTISLYVIYVCDYHPQKTAGLATYILAIIEEKYLDWNILLIWFFIVLVASIFWCLAIEFKLNAKLQACAVFVQSTVATSQNHLWVQCRYPKELYT